MNFSLTPTETINLSSEKRYLKITLLERTIFIRLEVTSKYI